MALKRITDNVQIDTAKKRIYVNMAKATETDLKIAELNKGEGYTIRPASEARINNGKNRMKSKQYWLEHLTTNEQKKKFEELCKENYFKAQSYAEAELAKK